jgi:HAD superfamily hydrolase (TIGR01548 family)
LVRIYLKLACLPVGRGFGDWNLKEMDILIFDMDGVLIDVSRSYRETIQRTVQIYLEACLGFEKPKREPVTKEDISLFKSAGGFNNDWDLTSGLLLYLLSISGFPLSPKKRKFSSIDGVVSHLKIRSSNLSENISQLIQKKNLTPFIRKVKLGGGGLKGVRKALKGSWEGWVYGDGDLNQENVVKRIFQEVYLGKKFTSLYHLPVLFHKKQGLYLRERLIIPKGILSSLRKRFRLGIASGRPRFEAELALKRFRLSPYFDSMVTLDECHEEEARIFRTTGGKVKYTKPHPYSLLRVVQEIGIPYPRCGYVGDVVDDMLAARAAGKELDILAIGFLHGPKKDGAVKASLLKAGADVIVGNSEELLQLVTY